MRPSIPQSLHGVKRWQTCQAVLVVALTVPTATRLNAARAAMQPTASTQGVLLVETVNGRTAGNQFHQPTAGQVLAVRDATVRVLARLPNLPYTSHLAPSPDGRHVVFSSGQAGLWTVNSDGSGRHTLLAPPPTTCQNGPFATGQVVWAPGGRRLAYGVFLDNDVIRRVAGRSCPREPWGVWKTPYSSPSPRQLWESQPAGEALLTWSPGARSIVVSTVVRVGSGAGGRDVPTVLALDPATGRSRTLLKGAWNGISAPLTGTLAFTTGSIQGPNVIWAAGAAGKRRHVLAHANGPVSAMAWSPDGRTLAYTVGRPPSAAHPAPMTLWIVGARSRRPRLLATGQRVILSPVWSPDGGSIAYIGGSFSCLCGPGASYNAGTAVYTVDVVTGASRIVLYADERGVPLLSPAQFTELAWMRSSRMVGRG